MASFPLDLDGFKTFLERAGIEHVHNEKLGQIGVPRPGSEGWAVRFVPWPERGMATVAYPLPGVVPPARRAELARACNLLNARTFLGAWVLNMEAGELYFRHTVLTAGVLFEDAGVRALLQVVVGTVELHVDRLQAVLDGAPAESVLVEID
ncbi:MAG: YbjN domain-containing protein [Alphaproteobacteria bacterium]|nr:YbjN domain-containing protein [Alphaproteobacteria bacterium]MCB9691066.1 YbjN domain-containing protein [Alphaproteobacteria bacterium]